MSSTGKDAWIPEIWTKEVLELTDKMSVMKGLVTSKDAAVKNGGDTVHFRIPSAVTVGNYTRETAISYASHTLTKVSLTIDQEKYFAYQLDDADKTQLDLDYFNVEAPEAAKAIRDTIDAHLLGKYASTDASNVVGSTGSPMSITADNVYNWFTRMNRLLDDQNAKGKRQVVVPPVIKEIILNSPQLSTRGSNLVDETVENGMVIKKFAGFEVYVTTNMSTVSGTYPLMFFTPRFIYFAHQLSQVEKIRQTTFFGDGVRGLHLYGSLVPTPYDGDGGVIYAAA